MQTEAGVKFKPVCDMERLGVYMVYFNGFGCDFPMRWFYGGYLQSKSAVILASQYWSGNLAAYDLVYAYQLFYNQVFSEQFRAYDPG